MKHFWKSFKNEYCPLVLNAIFVGVIVGVVVAFFNYAIKFLVNQSVSIYEFTKANWWFVPILFAGLIALALIQAYLHKKAPEARGGGMPQTIAMCKGQVKYNWFRAWWSTILCSFTSYFAGLPLGAEGPSMFVGSTTAEGVWKTTKGRPYMKKYLMAAGASSGLAATFNAPLAGLVFTVEKVYRKFSPLLLIVVGISVICSTLTINLVSLLWGGTTTFFDFGFLQSIDISQFWMLLVLGVVAGLTALGFQLLLIKTQKFFDKKTKVFPYWLRLVITFVLVGVTGIFLIEAVTGGHDLIQNIANMNIGIVMLVVLLVVKLALIALCYNSGATGGLFVPSLAIGALIGGIMAYLFVQWGLPSECFATIVCFCMLAFLAGTTHAPISALILLLEITGFSGSLLSAGIAIIIAFVVAQVLHRKSMYEEQVERLANAQGADENKEVRHIKVTISESSVLINKRISDIFMPQSLDVSGIYRDGKLIVSDSETRILPKDKVEFVYQLDNASEVKEYLKDIG